MTGPAFGQHVVIDDSIKAGDLVQCRDAYNVLHWMTALSSVEAGIKFPRVWVCTPEDGELLGQGFSEHELAEQGFKRLPWPRSAIVAIRRRVVAA